MTTRWTIEDEPTIESEPSRPWIQNRRDNTDYQLRLQLEKQIRDGQRKTKKKHRPFIEKTPGVFEIQ